MAQPMNAAEIQQRLDTIDAALMLYMTNPAKFTDMIAGTVKISIPEYLAQLRTERAFWQDRLDNVPSWTMSDFEQSI